MPEDPSALLQDWADPASTTDFAIDGFERSDGTARAWAHWHSIEGGQEALWVLVAVSLQSHVVVASYVGAADKRVIEQEARCILTSLREDGGCR